jgi:hypothetical protein
MKRITFAALIATFFWSSTSAGFEHDVSLGEAKKQAGQHTAQYMKVNETAYITYHSLCWENNTLYLSPYGAVDKYTGGRYEISFTLKPGGKGHLSIPAHILPDAVVAISRRVGCDIWQSVPHMKTDLIDIEMINGASSMSDLLKTIKPID